MNTLASLVMTDIMTTKVEVVGPDTSLAEAARRMADKSISSLVVMENSKPVSVLTEHHIACFILSETPAQTPIGQLVSGTVHSVPATLDFRAAYSQLRQIGTHHLIVVDELGGLLGLVSETDLRNHLGLDVLDRLGRLEEFIECDASIIDKRASLAEAVKLMAHRQSEFVIVTEHNKPIGILTERDLTRFFAQGLDLKSVRVADRMTTNLVTVHKTELLTKVVELMRQHHIRHLPVVEDNGELLGILSQHRMLEILGLELLQETMLEEDHLREENAKMETRLQLAMEVGRLGCWEFDHVTGRLTWGESLLQVLGYTDAPSTLEGWLVKVHQDDRAMAKQLVEAGFVSGKLHLIHRIQRADGSYAWLETRGNVISRDAAGRPLYSLGTASDITERHNVMEELEHERGILRLLVETMPDIVWLKSPEGVYLSCNPRFERLCGFKEPDILGKTDFDLFGHDIAKSFREHDLAAVESRQPVINEEQVTFADDGHSELLETIKSAMRDNQGSLIGVLGIARDITEHKRAELRIQRLKNFYAALSHINETIIHANDEEQLFNQVCRIAVEDGLMRLAWVGTLDAPSGRIVPAYMYGIGTEYLKEIVISTSADVPEGHGPTGTAWRENHPVINNDTLHNATMLPWRDRVLTYGWCSSASFPVVRAGRVYAIFTVYHAEPQVFDDEVVRLLAELCADLSFALDNFDRERERLESLERIHELAYFDPLTKLPNRSLMLDRLGHELSLASREGRQSGLILLDIDRFKNLNDARGHARGDDMLQVLAKRIADLLREGDTLARLGGDEFAILLHGLNHHSEVAGHHAAVVAEKLHAALQAPFVIGDDQIYVTISMGVSLFPDGNDDIADQILRRADTALQLAKGDGGNRTVFFETEMGKAAEFYFQIDRELRQAIPAGQLRLYVQPQFDANGTVVAGEALVRWQHPVRGLVLPAVFIPVAEETDLIVEVDAWVFTEVCKLIAAQDVQGYAIRISVNISPRHFRRPNFVRWLKDVLLETGADPSYLTLEVTEGLVIDNVNDVIAKMTELSALGIHFSIDDFGTGYSSLAYLKRLPIHEIKIDKSFVHDITIDEDDAALVETILAVASHLKLRVVAEGVETAEQAAFLNSRGNVIHQGYLFARPEPAEVFTQRRREVHRTPT